LGGSHAALLSDAGPSKNKADRLDRLTRTMCLLVSCQLRLMRIVDTFPVAMGAILGSAQNQLEVPLTFAIGALFGLMIFSHGDCSFPIHLWFSFVLEFRVFSDYLDVSYYNKRARICKTTSRGKKTENTAM